MACKLYIKTGSTDFRLGTFKDRQQAEKHFHLVRAKLETEYGSDIKPIYVEDGKGRGK